MSLYRIDFYFSVNFLLYFFCSLSSHVFFIISFFTAWPLRLVQGRNATENTRRQQNSRRDVQGIHCVTSGPRWLSIFVLRRQFSPALASSTTDLPILSSFLSQSLSFSPRIFGILSCGFSSLVSLPRRSQLTIFLVTLL